MSYVGKLKQRVVEAEDRTAYLEALVEHLRSKLDAFWTGDIPENASLDHMILAKYGRKRIEDKSKKPALLVKNANI